MEGSTILIIEDDVEINNLISTALTREGFKPIQVFNGKAVLDLFPLADIQMIILDLMLPGMGGMEVLRRVREITNIPVMILSAKAEESDRIIGLGVGADDYMTKPFSVSELVARVNAQLRRYLYFNQKVVENEIIQFGDIKMDIGNYQVTKRDSPINLTPKEFEILKLFLSNPTRAFTKAQIFTQVWPDDYMGDDNTVMVHIRRLRSKIEDDPDVHVIIKTVWGIGYKLGELK